MLQVKNKFNIGDKVFLMDEKQRMRWKRTDPKDKVVIRDYLVQNYEYLGDGRIRHKGCEKARKTFVGPRYCQIVLKIKGRQHCLFYHQVVWIVCHGEYPKGEIDHIDRNRMNNKIENLRDVTSSQNEWNKLYPWKPNSKTNVPGVMKKTRFEEYYTYLFGKRIFSTDKYKLFHDATLCGKTYK